MIAKIIKRNRIFAFSFSALAHLTIFFILLYGQANENNFIIVSDVQVTPHKQNAVRLALKAPYLSSVVSKKTVINTNINKNTEDDLTKYTAVGIAPRFIMPLNELIEYPAFELENHIEGEVIYEVYLKSNGEIKTIHILKATTKAMGDAVLTALWQVKILPAYNADRKPFACKFRQRIPFRIPKN